MVGGIKSAERCQGFTSTPSGFAVSRGDGSDENLITLCNHCHKATPAACLGPSSWNFLEEVTHRNTLGLDLHVSQALLMMSFYWDPTRRPKNTGTPSACPNSDNLKPWPTNHPRSHNVDSSSPLDTSKNSLVEVRSCEDRSSM